MSILAVNTASTKQACSNDDDCQSWELSSFTLHVFLLPRFASPAFSSSMSLSSPVVFHRHGRLHVNSVQPSALAAQRNEVRMVSEPASAIPNFEDAKERISKMFNKVELSISAYDTAWVAIVPSRSSWDTPCFPETVNWILNNQLPDGSWGLADRHPLLIKDALSSTLACILALKRWQVGEGPVMRGLEFIRSNFAAVVDEQQHSPIGFDVVFPSMIDYAMKMEVNFHLPQEDIEALLNKKDLELNRIKGKSSSVKNHYSAYISEGIGKLQDWEMAMSYQRKNGSLFNSPSATAAALFHIQDSGCRSYLESVLQHFGDAVPTVYPLDTYAQLHMVDKIQRLGIDRHFTENIRIVLDETFWLWIQGHEDLFWDIGTCALAFRLLRHHGYPVSSEPLAIYGEQECCFDRFGGHHKDVNDALELYRASELIIEGDDSLLEKQNAWSKKFLKQQFNCPIPADAFAKFLIKEVDDALKNPCHASLEHLARRRYMEHYNMDTTVVYKTSFRFMNLEDEFLLKFAIEDFNTCQSIHLQELTQLKQWFTENRLDQLHFSRQKLVYCYFSVTATIFSPELSDARVAWTKSSTLTAIIDDFFDIGSSVEEQLNLIQLVEWRDTKNVADCCSEKVHIVFSALHQSVSDMGDQACRYQDRNVAEDIWQEWHRLMLSMWREAEMSRNKAVPTIEEYMENAYISFALGPIVLPTVYMLGPKLSQEAIKSEEYQKLFKLMSVCGRLLNDIRGFEREAKEGKLNAVPLHIHHSNGAISKEKAIREMAGVVVSKRRELLRLVLQNEDSVVPRICKDLFWKMSKVLHLFYREDDGFTSQKMETEGIVRKILQDPVVFC